MVIGGGAHPVRSAPRRARYVGVRGYRDPPGDREMGKQGDRKARKQRAQEREQHRRQASANREP